MAALSLVVVDDDTAKRCLLLRRFDDGETAYQQALALAYHPASTATAHAGIFRQLGMVAQGQRRLQRAACYCRRALHLMLEHGDRHGAATTYHEFGSLMRRAGRYGESLDYYLNVQPILAAAGDGGHSVCIALRNLARLWHGWGDDVVVAGTAEVMGQPPDAVRAFFEQVPADDSTDPGPPGAPPTID